MSLEQTLERIAIALERGANASEEMLSILKESEAPVAAPKATKVKQAKADAPTPAETPVPEELQPTPTQKVYTTEEVLNALKTVSLKKDVTTAKGLMVKYGAKKEGPMMKDIPIAKYPSLMEEIRGLGVL